MNKRKTTGQKESLELLCHAHGLVRGPLRTAIEAAIDVAENGRGADLTNMAYDRLLPGQKLADPKRPGLVMRCGARHGKYWVFRTTGPMTLRQIEIPISDYPALGIAEASEMWTQPRVPRKQPNAILTDGPDGKPIPAARLLDRDHGGVQMTVGDLVARYIEDCAQ